MVKAISYLFDYDLNKYPKNKSDLIKKVGKRTSNEVYGIIDGYKAAYESNKHLEGVSFSI